jgi:hypothetical protein
LILDIRPKISNEEIATSQVPAAIFIRVTGIAYGKVAANGIFSASVVRPFIEHSED